MAGWLDRSYPLAYRTAYGLLGNRADAEDAVQEAFLRAWRFRSSVPDDAGMAPWLYRVVVNASLSRRRGDRRYRETVTGPVPATGGLPSDPDPGPGPEGRAVAGETSAAVVAALARLSPELRVVVVLRYYAQLSEREIAQVIRRRPGTVKSRLHAARGRLGADPVIAAMAEVRDGRGAGERCAGGLPTGAGGR